MKILVNHASQNDLVWLSAIDTHISPEIIQKKISQEEILVARVNGQNIGCLRFNYFWDEIPFMNYLWVIENERNSGAGRDLVTFWENEMKIKGHINVMTSTLKNENAQYFYNKLGYEVMGSFLIERESSSELLLYKTL